MNLKIETPFEYIEKLEQNNTELKRLLEEVLESYEYLNEYAFHQSNGSNKIRIKNWKNKIEELNKK
jgi:hypothetical protein